MDRTKKWRMPRTTALFAVLVTGVLSAIPAAAQDDDWEVNFGNRGVVIESPGDDIIFNIDGRIHVDALSVDEGITQFDDDTDIRRLRFGLAGTFYGKFRFKVERDVASVSPGFKNVWATFRPAKGIEIKGGNFVAPFSMEQISSSNEIATMERSLASALAQNFLVGGAVKINRDHWTLTAGYFSNPLSLDPGIDNDAGESIIARGTFAPIRRRNSVLHFGAAVEHRSLNDGIGSRERTFPEARLAGARLIDTRTLDGVENYTNLGFEAAYMRGPITISSQFVRRQNDAPALGDPAFNGQYVQAAWVVTGESRRYSRRSGVFGGVRPKSKFGAVEIVGRYSRLDLTDELVTGGEEENYLAGVNWYLGRNVRFMTNFIHAKASPNRNGENETANIVQGRAQLNF